MRGKANTVPLRTVVNTNSRELYKPDWTPVRPEATAHEAIPSRRADGLVYRDGRRMETLPDASGEIKGYGGGQ